MTISTEFLRQGLIYDRYLGIDVDLPYTFEDIKIQPNDTATYSVLNIKFKHLYDNFLYLFKNCKLASNVIPISATAIAGVSASSNKFTWQRNLSTSQFIPIYNDPALVGMDHTNAMLLVKNADKDQYSAFTTDGSRIRVFNFDSYGSYITNSFTQTEVDAGYGVYYTNITAFAVANDYLYVLDSKLNRLAKYDASGFTTGNNVTENRLYYVDSVGNYGNFVSKTEFHNPRSLVAYKDNLFVLDSGNSCIKKYDLNLNWVQTYRLYVDFLSAYPVDLNADINGNLYVITENKKIYIYNNDISNKSVLDLTSILEYDERPLKVVFSQSDTNVFYLLTNKNVFKKLVNQPINTVGKYLLYLFKYDVPADRFTSFATAPSLYGTSDHNLVFSVSGNTGKMGYFYDNLNLFDILAVNDFDIYTFDDMAFNKEEYIQNWIFNKNLSKLIINHMRLRDQIIGKYIAARDIKGNITFRGTRYLLPDELDDIFFEQDITYYIGANEIFANNIVNRALRKIYDIQVKILNILRAEVTNYPNVDQVITLN
jgi:hypothetical protein